VFRDILCKRNALHCPELGELEFRGLRVEESWSYNSQCIVLPLLTTFSLIVVAVAKLTYSDWATAWTVGCFFVGLIPVLMLWVNKGLN